MNAYDTLTYYNVLPDLIYNYNNIIWTIMEKLIDVFNKKQQPIQQITYIKPNFTSPFQIGDTVCYLRIKKNFECGFLPIYSI